MQQQNLLATQQPRTQTHFSYDALRNQKSDCGDPFDRPPSTTGLLKLTVHSVQIAVPPSINLLVSCLHNETKVETQHRRKVDPISKTACFDEELSIKVGASSESFNVSLKLMAVSDSKAKLIGVLQLRVKGHDFQPLVL